MIFDPPAAIKGLKTGCYGQWTGLKALEYSCLRASGNTEKSRHYIFENPGIGISKKSRDPGISRDPAGACLRVTSLNKAFNIFPFSNACQYPFDQNVTALPTFTCLSRLELFVVFVFFCVFVFVSFPHGQLFLVTRLSLSALFSVRQLE